MSKDKTKRTREKDTQSTQTRKRKARRQRKATNRDIGKGTSIQMREQINSKEEAITKFVAANFDDNPGVATTGADEDEDDEDDEDDDEDEEMGEGDKNGPDVAVRTGVGGVEEDEEPEVVGAGVLVTAGLTGGGALCACSTSSSAR